MDYGKEDGLIMIFCTEHVKRAGAMSESGKGAPSQANHLYRLMVRGITGTPNCLTSPWSMKFSSEQKSMRTNREREWQSRSKIVVRRRRVLGEVNGLLVKTQTFSVGYFLFGQTEQDRRR